MAEKVKQASAEEIARMCADAAEDRKANDVVMLKMTELSVMADYFVLCTANSEPHLRAISNHIGREVRDKLRLRPKSVEGTPESEWILMDYFNVLVHIMTPKMRDNYQLESLWGDAPRLEAVQTVEDVVKKLEK